MFYNDGIPLQPCPKNRKPKNCAYKAGLADLSNSSMGDWVKVSATKARRNYSFVVQDRPEAYCPKCNGGAMWPRELLHHNGIANVYFKINELAASSRGYPKNIRTSPHIKWDGKLAAMESYFLALDIFPFEFLPATGCLRFNPQAITFCVHS